MSINPVGFIIVGATDETVPKFIPVEHKCSVDKLIDYIPDLMEKFVKSMEKICNKSSNAVGTKNEEQIRNEKETRNR